MPEPDAQTWPLRKPVGDCCDRHPSAAALTAWYKVEMRALVVLCAHCTNRHDLSLVEQGFELTIDYRESVTRSTREPEPA